MDSIPNVFYQHSSALVKRITICPNTSPCQFLHHVTLGRIPPSQFAQQQRIQIFATDSNNNQFLD